MRLITRQDRADESVRCIIARNPFALNDKAKKLKELNNPTYQQVDEVMGSSGWTRLDCDDCRNSVDKVMELGEDMDCESATAYICLDCITEAFNKMKVK